MDFKSEPKKYTKYATPHESWLPLFEKYDFDLDEIANEGKIYPPKEQMLRVFEMDVSAIRILLLGQDPYHNPGQAHGLSFSVPKEVIPPPSLVNIFKELKNEFPERNYEFSHGNLERWFYEEHIFLLNAALSVAKNDAGSHMEKWENFTDDVIQFVAERNSKCVFLLFGNFAKSKAKFIKSKNRVVCCVHPSPLSAHRGFFNSGVFQLVEKSLKEEVNWNI